MDPASPLFLGTVRVSPRAVLAPMEGVTDLTFRRLIRHIGGCGLTYTEFIPGRSLAQGVPQFVRMAEFDADERPFAIQLYGNVPEIMADAARYAQDLGADLVDLNMGCPSKSVCQNSGGSSLMKDPALALAIVRAMRRALTVPFTVKMRSGWDASSRNAPELAGALEQEGVQGLTVHWRTRADLYGGQRDLSTIAEVVRRVKIPVLANGDIVDVATALDTLAQTGASGVMIGRGAIRDPWIFRKVQAALAGQEPPQWGARDRLRVLLQYFDALPARFRTDQATLGRMKKISKYFAEGLPEGGEGFRDRVLHAQSVAEARQWTQHYLELA